MNIEELSSELERVKKNRKISRLILNTVSIAGAIALFVLVVTGIKSSPAFATTMIVFWGIYFTIVTVRLFVFEHFRVKEEQVTRQLKEAEAATEKEKTNE